MKLEPIAKPIRIRIKIGKNEYSSLSEVKNNFSIEELFPLFVDGRLEKWMRQIGEFKKANDLQELHLEDQEASFEGYQKLILFFFPEIKRSNIVSMSNTVDYIIRCCQGVNRERYNSNIVSLITSAERCYADLPRQTILYELLSIYEYTDLFKDKQIFEFFNEKGCWGYALAKLADEQKRHDEVEQFLTNCPNTVNHQKILDEYFSLIKDQTRIVRRQMPTQIYNGTVWIQLANSSSKYPMIRTALNSWKTDKNHLLDCSLAYPDNLLIKDFYLFIKYVNSIWNNNSYCIERNDCNDEYLRNALYILEIASKGHKTRNFGYRYDDLQEKELSYLKISGIIFAEDALNPVNETYRDVIEAVMQRVQNFFESLHKKQF